MNSSQKTPQSITTDDDSSVLDRQFRGVPLKTVVRQSIDAWKNDYSAYNRGVDAVERFKGDLIEYVTESVRQKLMRIDDEYVSRLEKENEELSVEIDRLHSSGYGALKNDLRWTENLLLKLMYLWNDAETIRVYCRIFA